MRPKSLSILLLLAAVVLWASIGLDQENGSRGLHEGGRESRSESGSPNSPEDFHMDDECIFNGYWDHLRGPDRGRVFARHFNIGKSSSVRTIGDVVEQGIPAIAMIGGFNSKRPEHFEAKVRANARLLLEYSSKQVPVVLLMDEPYLKGFSTEQLESLIDLSEQYFNVDGNRFQFTFSFSRAAMRRGIFKLPSNIKLAGVNWYPFYNRQYPSAFIETERQFKRDFARQMEPLFESRPDVDWFVTGQAFGDFYDQSRDMIRWRRPPLDAPLWYAELAMEYPQVVGLLWWVWQSRPDGRWIGTDQMPELYESQLRAFELICDSTN